MDNSLKISWYGRCCFSAVINNVKILFDPYDRFCNVDMGIVDAEILVISSSWHDHGHIGASPGSWVYTYPGGYSHSGIVISGIETEEERGTPTVVFNVQYKNISITNFADLGSDKIIAFMDSLTSQQADVIRKTNIAFVRSGRERLKDFINPKFIFPEHYFPRQFVEEQIPSDLKQDFDNQNIEVDKMLRIFSLPVEEIDDYKYNAVLDDNSPTKIIRLLKVHPQVKYTTAPGIKRYW